MPFVMTHLEIAKGIYSNTKLVKSPSQFYLGSIAPDCVHVRDDYESNMKKASHFCPDDTCWGEFINNTGWVENVLSALNSYRKSEKFDFYFGYFTHILADAIDNEKIYMPFKEKYSQLGLPLKDRGKAFYNDKSQNDFELYKMCKLKEEAMYLLKISVSIDIPNIVTASEVDNFKEIIIHQYDEGKSVFNDPVKYFSLQDNLDFIKNSISDILGLLNLQNVEFKPFQYACNTINCHNL